MCDIEAVDGRAILKAVIAPINGKSLFQELYGKVTTDEMNIVEAFSHLVERRINRDPKSFIEAIRTFNDSYKWADGVPNLRTGTGKVRVYQHSEWSELFSEPGSTHLPIEDRVRMVRAYLREVVVLNYDNPDMWHAFSITFPSHKGIWEIMRQGAIRRSTVSS